MQVESFSATDLAGQTTDLLFNTGKPTLIYYIDPECRWCKANAASFNTLARKLASNSRVLVLSSRGDKMENFLAETHPPDNRVLIVKSEKAIHDLGLTGTPQTFFINAAGRLEHHWTGAYDLQNRTDIERTFKLRLPEIIEPN
jgi:peroxiredoxin